MAESKPRGENSVPRTTTAAPAGVAPTDSAGVAESKSRLSPAEPSKFGWGHFRFTVNEALTLLVGLGTLFVAALAYFNSLNDAETRKAVHSLVSLAEQTKRQADSLANENQQLTSQTKYLSDQVKELRRQADATSQLADSAAQSATSSIRQLAITKDEIYLSHRPRLFVYPSKSSWVELDRVVLPSGETTDGALFHYNLIFSFKNIGDLPAEAVSVIMDVRHGFFENLLLGRQADGGDSQDEMCKYSERIRTDPELQEKYPLGQNKAMYTIPADGNTVDLEVRGLQNPPKNIFYSNSGPFNFSLNGTYIIGCVSYRIPGRAEFHHLRLFYEIEDDFNLDAVIGPEFSYLSNLDKTVRSYSKPATLRRIESYGNSED